MFFPHFWTGFFLSSLLVWVQPFYFQIAVSLCHFSMFIVVLKGRFGNVPAGSLLEWKGILIRNFGFFLDMAMLLMALGHYIHIWWLRGMAFHLVDAVLFLNIRVNICLICHLSSVWKYQHPITTFWYSLCQVPFFNLAAILTGLAKFNLKAYKRIHQTKNSSGTPSCCTSWCNIWRATRIWWWMCYLPSMLSSFVVCLLAFFNPLGYELCKMTGAYGKG